LRDKEFIREIQKKEFKRWINGKKVDQRFSRKEKLKVRRGIKD